MQFSLSKYKAFIPNRKRSQEDRPKKEKKEFRKPVLDILPPVLRIIVLEISKQPDKNKPDDVVLSDKNTQNSKNAGKPEPLVQRGPQSQKNVEHGINIRIDQKEKRKDQRKNEKETGFLERSIVVDFSRKNHESDQAKKREKRS